MTQIVLASIEDVRALKGQGPFHSPWLRIDQETINRFVDVERAKREASNGRTIAHGFLTLSLLSHLLATCVQFVNRKKSLNYGFDRVRFTSAVEVDSEIRAAIKLADFTDLGPQALRAQW